jgi:hypothetical protein
VVFVTCNELSRDRLTAGKQKYLVMLKGLGPEFNRWMPNSQLSKFPEVLDSFKNQYASVAHSLLSTMFFSLGPACCNTSLLTNVPRSVLHLILIAVSCGLAQANLFRGKRRLTKNHLLIPYRARVMCVHGTGLHVFNFVPPISARSLPSIIRSVASFHSRSVVYFVIRSVALLPIRTVVPSLSPSAWSRPVCPPCYFNRVI